MTTYIHIFVYHYRFFLHKYGGIKKFSNFALESKHSIMKRILAYSTSRFSRGPAEVARQQIAALVRQRKHMEDKAAAPAPTTKAKVATSTITTTKIVTTTKKAVRTAATTNWASQQLTADTSLSQFVASLHFI